MNISKIPRLNIVDAARGVAIIFMVFYHFLFSLDFYFGISISILDNPSFEFGSNLIRGLFIGLVGVSTRIIFFNNPDKFALLSKQSVRFLQISASAFLISACTYFLVPDVFIYWGVLHLIAFTVLVFTASISVYSLILMLILLVSLIYKFPVLIQILGLQSVTYSTLDFFPIAPWIFVALLAYFLFIPSLPLLLKVESKFKFPEFLTSIGKNSLFIYLVHQPIILAVLYIIKEVF